MECLPYSDEDENTIILCNSMDESHKYNVE